MPDSRGDHHSRRRPEPTRILHVVEINRVRLLELESVILALADALEAPATGEQRLGKATELLRGLRELQTRTLPVDALEGTAATPIALEPEAPPAG